MTISRFIQDNPTFSFYATAFGLFDVPDDRAGKEFFVEYFECLFPEIVLSFQYDQNKDPEQRMLAFDLLGQNLTLFFGTPGVSFGKALFSMGHLSCFKARITPNKSSSSENAAFEYLTCNGLGDDEAGIACQQMAAWSAALVLTGLLKISPKYVLKEMMLQAVNPDDPSSMKFMKEIAKHLRIFSDSAAIMKCAGTGQLFQEEGKRIQVDASTSQDFFASKPEDRFRRVDLLARSLIAEF